jgi:hypothetical protein
MKLRQIHDDLGEGPDSEEDNNDEDDDDDDNIYSHNDDDRKRKSQTHMLKEIHSLERQLKHQRSEIITRDKRIEELLQVCGSSRGSSEIIDTRDLSDSNNILSQTVITQKRKRPDINIDVINDIQDQANEKSSDDASIQALIGSYCEGGNTDVTSSSSRARTITRQDIDNSYATKRIRMSLDEVGGSSNEEYVDIDVDIDIDIDVDKKEVEEKHFHIAGHGTNERKMGKSNIEAGDWSKVEAKMDNKYGEKYVVDQQDVKLELKQAKGEVRSELRSEVRSEFEGKQEIQDKKTDLSHSQLTKESISRFFAVKESILNVPTESITTPLPWSDQADLKFEPDPRFVNIAHQLVSIYHFFVHTCLRL